MNISAVMIVKNEAECLAACLDSLRGFDEIVVVDTGSTDDTKSIALLYTDKVFDFPWCDDFAAARNFALSKATGDWCMSIDADHTLAVPPEIVRHEAKVLQVQDQRVGSVRLEHVSGGVHWNAWLFKRDPDIVWEGRIHECLNLVSNTRTAVHQFYGKSAAHKLDPERNLRILLNSNLGVPRNRFYLGREYAERGDHEQAIRWMQSYLEIGWWLPELCEAHLTLARAYWVLQDGNAARRHCLEAIRNNPSFKEALLFMADLHYEPWKSKWVRLAETADNEDVLFVRHP